MVKKAIHFFSENIKFKLTSSGKKFISKWIITTIVAENKTPGVINIIFCNDKYLLTVNQEYLNRKTFTDVITFDYCENKIISGDIFISIDRIHENAIKFNHQFDNELLRVIIHGVLHLSGYKDKTISQREKMTKKENSSLKLIKGKKLIFT